MKARSAAVAAIAAAPFAIVIDAASAGYGSLPSPSQGLLAAPPLAATQPATVEQRFPRRLQAIERVRVSVGARGLPLRVLVFDTVRVVGKGDYSFVIPGPIDDVRAAPSSESEPGLRTGGILWQGFAPRGRTLAAVATVSATAAAKALPLKLATRRGELRLENATSAVTAGLVSPAQASALAYALDVAHGGAVRNLPTGAQVVPIAGRPRSEPLRLVLPLALRGVARFAGGEVPIRTVVGARPVRIAGDGELRALELHVGVPTPGDVLRPPRKRTWRSFAASGGLGHGADATRFAVRRLAAAALAAQFQAFLANPDPRGATRTAYEYRLAATAAAASARTEDSRGPWLELAIACAFAVAAVAGVVVWAHS